MMLEDLNQQFVSLVEKELVLIDKFIEHVRLSSGLLQDEGVKSVLSHLAEEEEEHKQALRDLIENARALGAAATPVPPAQAQPAAEASDSQYGHFQRRDQNILTVGSLMGAKQ